MNTHDIINNEITQEYYTEYKFIYKIGRSINEVNPYIESVNL